MLRSDLCDFSDAYIVVKETITVTGGTDSSRKSRPLAFKNNAPFTNYISKINNVLFDNAEELDVVMPMYNLLEYRKNHRKTTGSLWNYYRDELSDDANDNINSNKNTINSESFKYKTSITGSTYNVAERITNAEGNQVNNPDYDEDKSGEKSWNCCSIKIFKQFLEKFKHAIDQLRSIFDFNLVWKLCNY